jgi:predicted NBD/HSP70 family sugar kinase
MKRDSSWLVAPRLVPPLDPFFRPAALANRKFSADALASKNSIPVKLALEQADGSVFHFDTRIFPEGHPQAGNNFVFLERIVKFLLWSRGGFRIHFSGPKALCEQLQRHFREKPTGVFDATIMGERIYEKPFEIRWAKLEEVPPARARTTPLGRHFNGCRIGFDLGGSDRKTAAVIDGKPVFSEEIVWDPVKQTDPQYHFDGIMDSLRRAAGRLPRVDAIGGSAAGVYVNNRVKVASLFRGVPGDLFNQRVKDLFLELKKTWRNIPFEVVNDGEVTALAGSMAIGENAVLGLAMGTSQAAGYVTPEGNITSWLNELAFAPIDYNPDAPVDEWSGDYGCNVQYFSQQCVGRLLAPAGIEVDAKLGLPEKLKHVQSLMEQHDSRARKIYESIGTYFGYAVAHLAEFYDLENVLILGRVTSGPGGEIILAGAKEVLKIEFPELAEKIAFHIPDEKQKRHGQAVAAASLPALNLSVIRSR